MLTGALLAVGLVGLVALVGRKFKRDADEIAPDPVADMRSVALVRLGSISGEQLARVAGIVAAHGPTSTAPFSRQACVGYVVEIYFDRDRRPARSDSQMTPFLLVADGQRAIVLPPCPIVALAERWQCEHKIRTVPSEIAAWLDDECPEWREYRLVRAVERRVEPGDRLAVVGWASRRSIGNDESAGYREGPEMVVLESEEGAPLSIGDDASLFT
jgi:hypothetical protein